MVVLLAKLTRLLEPGRDHAFRAADDPEALLERLVAEMTLGLIEAKDQLALLRARSDLLLRQADCASGEAFQWGERAKQAARAGEDRTARDALARQRELAKDAEGFRATWQKQVVEVENLKQALVRQSQRIERAKSQKAAILARARRVGGGAAVQGAVQGAVRAEPYELIERIDERTKIMEGERGLLAELSDEVIASEGGGTDNANLDDADLILRKRAMTETTPDVKRPPAKTSADLERERRKSSTSGAPRQAKR